MNDREDIDALAAEYVLGTLEFDERAAVAARRLRDPLLDAAILAWENRLSPLNQQVLEVEPPSRLWGRIEARIDVVGNEPADLRRALVRWRIGAVAASLAAVVLAGILVLRGPTPAGQQNYVAVFQQDDRQPAFLLSIDLATRELTIRPVAAPSQPGQTYQLWIASDRIGPSPRSLGLIGQPTGPSTRTLTEYDSGLLRTATFGISVEPEGGSPTGTPTGPAMHGTLYPAEPDRTR